jgi:hypothetical protein
VLLLCPVCWWEDDGQGDEDAAEVRLTVNGYLSLEEARGFYTRCGAAHPRFLPYVRQPQGAELDETDTEETDPVELTVPGLGH